MKQKQNGFTLIEVLLALAVVAIALTALLKSTGQSITNTSRIKEKTLSHWVMLQEIYDIQLNLINPTPNQTNTFNKQLFGTKWYLRVKITQTPIKHMQQISVSISNNQYGPFRDSLIGFRFHEE